MATRGEVAAVICAALACRSARPPTRVNTADTAPRVTTESARPDASIEDAAGAADVVVRDVVARRRGLPEPVAPAGMTLLALPDEDCGDTPLGANGPVARVCRTSETRGAYRSVTFTLRFGGARIPALRLPWSAHPLDAPSLASSALVSLTVFVSGDGRVIEVSDHPAWPCLTRERPVPDELPRAARELIARTCGARGTYDLVNGRYVRGANP